MEGRAGSSKAIIMPSTIHVHVHDAVGLDIVGGRVVGHDMLADLCEREREETNG